MLLKRFRVATFQGVLNWEELALKIAMLASLMLWSVTAASAQNLVPPEVVQLEMMQVEGGMRTVYVGNANNHYLLYCNTEASSGCITPEENQNYLLFNANTRWKMPGAKGFITLAFIQDWTIKYNQGENVGLVAENGKADLGLFIRDPKGGGYEQYIILSDGPIIYGTGMSDADRQKAWKAFFLKMVQAVAEQQGKDALGVKLAKRCMPGRDYCMMSMESRERFLWRSPQMFKIRINSFQDWFARIRQKAPSSVGSLIQAN
jgi:hypothetical protein